MQEPILNRAGWDSTYESVDHIVTSDYEAILSGIQFFGPRSLLGGNTHGQWHGCWGNRIHTWKVLRKQRMGGSSVGEKYNLLYGLVIDGYNKEGFGQWKQEHFFNLFLRIILQSWASIPILFLFTMTRLLIYYLCLLYNAEVLATFTLTFKHKLILRLWTYNFTHLLLVVLYTGRV